MVISCKKKQPHELTGEKAIFVGTWNWVYSTHRHNYCDGGGVVTDTLTPVSVGHNFTIHFFEEGQLNYFQDEELIRTNNVFLSEFGESITCSDINSMRFSISYEPDKEGELNGCIRKDTIRAISFEDFLFPYTPGCEDYHNYFVKE